MALELDALVGSRSQWAKVSDNTELEEFSLFTSSYVKMDAHVVVAVL